MLLPSGSRVAKLTFDGDTDVNHPIDGDLSLFKTLAGFLKVTKADTAAGDKLVIRLQETRDKGVTWNDRAVLEITGDQSPSTIAPETREFVLKADPGPLSADEEMKEPSGSAGGVALAAGELLHGPFAPPYRLSTASPTQNPGRYGSWRWVLDFTDVTTDDADFEGDLELWGHY